MISVTADERAAAMAAGMQPPRGERTRSPRKRGDSVSGFAAEGRNNRLTSEAGRLHRLGASPAEVSAGITAINETAFDVPLDVREVSSIVNSVTSYPVQEVIGEFTDFGNARRFHAFLINSGTPVHFVPEKERYVVWRGRWVDDDGGVAIAGLINDFVASEMDAARRMIIAGQADAGALRSKMALKLLNVKSQEAMLKMLSRVDGVRCSLTEFDRTADTVQAMDTKGQAVVIKLSTGEVNSASPEDKCLRVLGGVYDREAECPEFESVVTKAMCGDQEKVDYLQRLFGYCLYGHNEAEILPFLSGGGGNFKTTIVEVLLSVFGEYATVARPELLMTQDSSAPTNGIARLAGFRWVAMSESKEGHVLDDGALKRLASNERQVARFLNKEFFEFTPQWTVALITNHVPVTRATDDGFWRRLALIKFEFTVPENERVTNFRERFLIPEVSGILNWLLKGSKKYHEEGLKAPESVRLATGQYRLNSDLIATWADQCIVPGGFVALSVAWESFSEWYKQDSGEDVRGITSRRLTKFFRDKRLEVASSNGKTIIRGVELRK